MPPSLKTTFPSLARPASRFRPTKVLVAVDVALGAGWISAELTIRKVQEWSVEHPVSVAFGVGLILLVLTVFAVERFLAFNESKRWRDPALMALDAYVFAADRVARQILDELDKRPRTLPEPPTSQSRFVDGLAILLQALTANTGRGPVLALAESGRDKTSELAITATLTADMVTRYEPFAWIAGSIAAQQRRLAEIADRFGGMGRTMAGIEYSQNPRWASVIAEQSAETFGILNEYLEVLQTMRILVLEAT